MTAGIIAILAALIPFVIWLWKRAAAKKDDPNEKSEVMREQMAKAILKGDPERVNILLDDKLNRLHNLQNNPGRQGGSPDGGRQTLHPGG